MTDLPATMKALVLEHDGYADTMEGPTLDDLSKWVSLKKIDVPKPGPRGVVVKMALANVNPSDIHYIKGEYGKPREKGMPAGFEGCGTVVAAGERAQELVGKRVAVSASQGGSGTWAEYAMTDMAAAVPVSDQLRDEDASALFVNPLTAWAMVDLVKQAGAKSFVMTAGSSQLGKLMASLAKERGLHSIATVRREEHRSPLEGLGVGTVLNTARDDFPTMLKEAMKQHGPKIMLDAVGDKASAAIFAAMPAGARWILYGKMSPDVPDLPNLGQLVFMKKKIEGFWLSEWMGEASPEERQTAFEAVQQRFIEGSWKTDVAETLALDEAPKRLAKAMEGMNRGKILLKP
ncbi:NADH oxidoreductase [Fulvimarina pelagi HTCC2506]|uniref:NADH oxidoreductase n=1 Tax=Fulvimarina pelagi HTCC2506 TaxID=314231 RepID=Q0G5U4_9HYPH|nr:zinc-binding dehydrogenase [Fulvimarina pelagi]EAU42970.1 NADH oxidoreductase [Fulvimarina pelagi HTCC2506]